MPASSQKLKILLATRNEGKVREIVDLLRDFPIELVSLESLSNPPVVEEDGRTFAANAIKKAATLAMFSGLLTIGEDSGLQVTALKNAPGIYSARYSGAEATDAKNNRKLLRELRGVPLSKRGARYCCFVALAHPKGLLGVVSGSCQGLIAERSSGKNGFGYDPLFLIPRYGQTFGRLPAHVKSRISHRARAFKKLKKILAEYLSHR